MEIQKNISNDRSTLNGLERMSNCLTLFIPWKLPSEIFFNLRGYAQLIKSNWNFVIFFYFIAYFINSSNLHPFTWWSKILFKFYLLKITWTIQRLPLVLHWRIKLTHPLLWDNRLGAHRHLVRHQLTSLRPAWLTSRICPRHYRVKSEDRNIN